jgi:ACS family hexuronate transporter-like MFS transporter
MPEFDRKNVLSQRRWAICTLLFLATFLNYLDRQVLSLVSPLLRREFGLTGTSYSRIVTAFLLGYALTQLVGGRVIDKIGPRHALLAAMLWWSVAGMSVAASNSVWELGVAMLLMGVGEAACWPTAVKAIQECFQPRERAIAVGYFNSGSSVGAIVAPVIVTRLALRYSWRVAFITCGLIGLFWLIPW